MPVLAIYDDQHELIGEEVVIFGAGKHTKTKWVWENKHTVSFDCPRRPAYALIKIDGVALFNVGLELNGSFKPGDTISFQKGAITANEVRID
jgi:hypothetical protein